MSAGAAVCSHCGSGVGVGRTFFDEERGTGPFCCHGCLIAQRLLQGAGIDTVVPHQSTAAVGAGPGSGSYAPEFLARYVLPAEGGSALDILVDGFRCASCAWVIERTLAERTGVRQVRVNYATGLARVLFDPGSTSPTELFAWLARLGYRPHPYTPSAAVQAAATERKDLLVRLGTALFLTMQLMAFSFALYAGYFQGMSLAQKGYLNLFSLLVTTPVVFYCGWPFLAGAGRALRSGQPDMDLLIAVGALSSYLYSIFATLTGGETYFETAAMIVTLILVGRLLELGAKRRAAAGVERLLALTPEEARLVAGDNVQTVASAALVPGNLLLVGAGERFPVDGVIAMGETEVDESTATGEPLPVAKAEGDPVLGGSVNLTGTVRVRVERGAGDSFVARVARLVAEAQARRPPIQALADRIAALFVPLVLLLALATYAGWLLRGASGASALLAALATVLIACPCALGLATPTAILAGMGRAAEEGVIFRGGDVLERLARTTAVAFDKTGTLTLGRPTVSAVIPAPGWNGGELLALAASLETGSHHPLGAGIIAAAAERGLTAPLPGRVRAVPGGGVAGEVAGRPVVLGSARFLEGEGIDLPSDLPEPPTGGTAVLAAVNGWYAGALLLTDALRPGMVELVAYFADQGITSTLLSGDRPESARQVATALGIAEARGGLSPADKAAIMEEQRRAGRNVLMVGDGINDAPALAAAAVGCAFAGGTDIALQTSDLVIARPDPGRLALAHRLARRTLAVIRQNLAWAFLYNLIGIPLAMTGRLTPVYAAGAMAASSLCVVLNSLRLRRSARG